METVNIIAALTGVVAVIVSMITATSSTRNSAFTQLQTVVDQLRISLKEEQKRNDELERELRSQKALIDKLEIMLDEERDARKRVEKWARKLVRQLEAANIKPIDLLDTDDKIPPIGKTK